MVPLNRWLFHADLQWGVPNHNKSASKTFLRGVFLHSAGTAPNSEFAFL